jgi:hypothetical protein
VGRRAVWAAKKLSHVVAAIVVGLWQLGGAVADVAQANSGYVSATIKIGVGDNSRDCDAVVFFKKAVELLLGECFFGENRIDVNAILRNGRGGISFGAVAALEVPVFDFHEGAEVYSECGRLAIICEPPLPCSSVIGILNNPIWRVGGAFVDEPNIRSLVAGEVLLSYFSSMLGIVNQITGSQIQGHRGGEQSSGEKSNQKGESVWRISPPGKSALEELTLILGFLCSLAGQIFLFGRHARPEIGFPLFFGGFVVMAAAVFV